MKKESINSIASYYLDELKSSFDNTVIEGIEKLAYSLIRCWKDNKKVFICGNGGSAANAIHIANDFIYGIGVSDGKSIMPGLSIEALSSNQAVLTCLANDIGYENIFSFQLDAKATQNDLLIVLSGSGNSKNIVNALKIAKEKKLETYAILAFDGGKSIGMADNHILIRKNNMEIAEDAQMIIFNICKKYLSLSLNDVFNT